MTPVPVDGRTLDWPRKVANAINGLITLLTRRGAYPFEMLTADPADPAEGRAYFSTATHKLRVYDGTSWIDAW